MSQLKLDNQLSYEDILNIINSDPNQERMSQNSVSDLYARVVSFLSESDINNTDSHKVDTKNNS